MNRTTHRIVPMIVTPNIKVVIYMGNQRTKEGIYIFIIVLTIALVILIVMYNWYYVYRNVNRIKRVADEVLPNADRVSSIVCNGIREAGILSFIATQDAITKAKNRCLVVPT